MSTMKAGITNLLCGNDQCGMKIIYTQKWTGLLSFKEPQEKEGSPAALKLCSNCPVAA